MIDLFKEHPYIPFKCGDKKCIDDFFDYKFYQTHFKNFKLSFDKINSEISELFFKDYFFTASELNIIDCRRFFFNLYIKSIILSRVENKYINEEIELKIKSQELDSFDEGKSLIPNRFSNHYSLLAKEIGHPFVITQTYDQNKLYEPIQSADLLIQKLFLYDINFFLSRIKKRFLKKKYSILQVSENELVREINSHLVNKKVQIVNIKKDVDEIYNQRIKSKSENRVISSVFSILNKNLENTFEDINLKYFDAYCRISSNVIGLHIIHLNEVKIELRNLLKKYKTEFSSSTFFSNGLFSGKGLALSDALLYNDFKIITTEHGLKFSKDSKLSLISDEARTSTHILNFNKNTERLYVENPIRGYDTQIVGEASSTKKIKMSQLQRKLNQIIYKLKAPQVIYVSHSVELNSEKYFPYTKSNPCLVRDETFLLESLGGINKNVLIKLYPTKQYLFEKSKFIKDIIKKYNNLRLLEKETDFRYIRTAADIIITQSSESTLGWCIGANKPLVFLDSKFYEPLKDNETIEAFKKCFFFINYDKIGWQNELIDLLNKPYNEIMRLWNEKEKYRKKFDDMYFLSSDLNAGDIGSEYIFNLMHKN